MRIFLAALLISTAALPALAQDVPGVSGARDASQRFTSALSTADAATAASFFTDDAVVLPPGRGELGSRPEIQRFFGGMTRSVKELKYVPESQKALDESTVREVGSFSFKTKQGSGDVSGKYMLVWTKVGSDWKIAADMWNRSQGGGSRAGRNGANGANGANSAEEQ